MTVEQTAMFLSSSILIMLAAIVWVIAILVINNLLYKHWKPLNLYKVLDPNARFAEPHELEKLEKDKK